MLYICTGEVNNGKGYQLPDAYYQYWKSKKVEMLVGTSWVPISKTFCLQEWSSDFPTLELFGQQQEIGHSLLMVVFPNVDLNCGLFRARDEFHLRAAWDLFKAPSTYGGDWPKNMARPNVG